MSTPVRIAFLSTAHIHTRGFLDNVAKAGDGRTVQVIWDDVADRGRRYAGEFATRFEPDLDKVLADPAIQGFVICAENTRHLPLLRKALPAGKPVFCEKPLLTAAAGLVEVRNLAARHRAPLFCGYFQPFGKVNRGVARLLAAKALGRITTVRFRNAHHAAYGHWFDSPDLAWFADPDLAGGGALMDMGTHAVHLLRTLFGPVEAVWATVANRSGVYTAVDDHGIAHLRFASGVLGTVEAAWIHQGGPGGLEIQGTEAAIVDKPGQGLVVVKPKQDPVPVEPADAQPTQVDRLVAVIQGQIPAEALVADLDACCDSVAIMEAAYRSAKSGAWEKVGGNR